MVVIDKHKTCTSYVSLISSLCIMLLCQISVILFRKTDFQPGLIRGDRKNVVDGFVDPPIKSFTSVSTRSQLSSGILYLKCLISLSL